MVNPQLYALRQSLYAKERERMDGGYAEEEGAEEVGGGEEWGGGIVMNGH